MPKKRELTDEDQALRERLGAAIRRESSARGKGPQMLASAAGVSVAHQYRVESGETTPDALYLYKVCRLIGITMDSLFKDTNSVAPAPAAAPARKASPGQSGGIQQHATGDHNVQIGTIGDPPRGRGK